MTTKIDILNDSDGFLVSGIWFSFIRRDELAALRAQNESLIKRTGEATSQIDILLRSNKILVEDRRMLEKRLEAAMKPQVDALMFGQAPKMFLIAPEPHVSNLEAKLMDAIKERDAASDEVLRERDHARIARAEAARARELTNYYFNKTEAAKKALQ